MTDVPEGGAGAPDDALHTHDTVDAVDVHEGFERDDPSTAANLVHRARALAQAHPLSAMAKRYIERAADEERATQPYPEAAMWATMALTTGYCVRRVEEVEQGIDATPRPAAGDSMDVVDALAALDQEATAIAAAMRADEADRYMMGDAERTFAALDRIIEGETERRLDRWSEDLEADAWDELREYLTWWVVKGYALRVAEVGEPSRAVGSGTD